MEELLKSLIDIQQNLNAPKGQFNNFGKFNYRSLEDIEAAVKVRNKAAPLTLVT